MRILIYGAGVIGSLYGALFAEHGCAVTVYARGNRLADLNRTGLRYRAGGTVKTATVKVIPHVDPDDCYDFVLLAVREQQLDTALCELQSNVSPTIVTMVNTLEDYSQWEAVCGQGRILPAFPGAGGGFRNGILDAALTPRLIQPTTFGEIGGKKSERTRRLSALLERCHIPWQIVSDMHLWQLCHLAMVVPLADACCMTEDPAGAGHAWPVMVQTAHRIKSNFKAIRGLGYPLSPGKMNLFCCLPTGVLAAGLKAVFLSRFAEQFIYPHAEKAPDEMRELHRQFYGYLREKGYPAT